MFKQWLFLMVVMLSGALAGDHAARAADASDLPPVDPPGRWHVLTQDDATSDSKCIGNPVTPLCAVETVLACFTRRDDRLCQVGMGLDHLPGRIRLNKRPDLSEHYRVVAVEKIKAPWRSKINGERLASGDAVLKILSVLCQNKVCEKPMGTPTAYLARPVDRHWAVITWESPPW